MAILEFTAQALSHFLFHPRLSVGGEELASQVVCPLEPGNARQRWWPGSPEQSHDSSSGTRGQEQLWGTKRSLVQTRNLFALTLVTHWVLYLPSVPVLTSCCVSALSESKIKLNRLCYLEDIYSCMEELDYFVDECCGNVSLLRKVKQDHLQIVKVW